MQKLHVEDAIKKAKNFPGPNRYEMRDHFKVRQGEIACNSRQYSMGRKLDYMKQQLKEKQLVPGPGTYNSTEIMEMGKTS